MERHVGRGNTDKKHVRARIIAGTIPRCTEKGAYGSKGEAMARARKSMARRPGQPLSVYQCRDCNRWHITSWTTGPDKLYPVDQRGE
jgi:hypothetical protein